MGYERALLVQNNNLVPQKNMGYEGLWVMRGMGYEGVDCICFLKILRKDLSFILVTSTTIMLKISLVPIRCGDI